MKDGYVHVTQLPGEGWFVILWILLFSGLNSRCVLHMASQSVDVLACRALPHIIYFVIGLDIGIARCPVCGFFIPFSFGFVISGVVCLHAYIKWLFRVPRPQTADCLCLPSPTIILPTYLSSGRMANIGMTDGSARVFTGSSFLSHLDCIYVPPCLLYSISSGSTKYIGHTRECRNGGAAQAFYLSLSIVCASMLVISSDY